jgi:hypothetical protein
MLEYGAITNRLLYQLSYVGFWFTFFSLPNPLSEGVESHRFFPMRGGPWNSHRFRVDSSHSGIVGLAQ